MDILFPLHSVIGTELCPSSIPQIIHFVLFVVFSLVILIILRLYIPREPSSVPPREDSENKTPPCFPEKETRKGYYAL
ncbi:C5orf60 isoform 3 [Pan troglodytes]|uniref:C5orf60 isoform 3 n=1 Tax=Pan troglodytes TaxID=9598 RepID=A0A2J8JTN7_PANTR|nr:C5orf60 isoform 3 [Pan troglodytes]